MFYKVKRGDIEIEMFQIPCFTISHISQLDRIVTRKCGCCIEFHCEGYLKKLDFMVVEEM